MNLFSRLFQSSESDPTSAWPPAQGPLPRVSLERRALETFGGRLSFGDPVAAAQLFGRPSRYQAGKGSASLAYDSWGLTLDFENDRFVQATFAVGGEPEAPIGPDGLTLSERTSKAELVDRFGEATKMQELDEETILYYTSGGMTSEFQIDDQGRLVGWDVYLD